MSKGEVYSVCVKHLTSEIQDIISKYIKQLKVNTTELLLPCIDAAVGYQMVLRGIERKGEYGYQQDRLLSVVHLGAMDEIGEVVMDWINQLDLVKEDGSLPKYWMMVPTGLLNFIYQEEK